jgi:3',5'-cyclic AMP phosphodiesterase CpdA
MKDEDVQMGQKKSNLITRRQAILSIAAVSAGALIKPSSIFCSPVKDKLRFAVVGDWGTGEQDCAGIASQMATAHQRTPFDFVISSGDNIYPNGSGRYFGKNFEQPFSGLIKDRVDFYAVLGNHDVESGRQDQCQYPLFNMGGRNYYKVEKGNGLVDFFMLDSTDFDSEQAAWLESSLRDSKARWKVPIFHHPIYSSGKKHGSAVGLRKQLEPLFTRYGVNVAFSGHDHIYERTKLQQGIQYFVSGAGGKTRRGDIELKSPIREVSFDDDNHFMVIEIDDERASFQAISEGGTQIDSGSIKRG